MEGRYISIAPYLREHPLLKETRRKKREKKRRLPALRAAAQRNLYSGIRRNMWMSTAA